MEKRTCHYTRENWENHDLDERELENILAHVEVCQECQRFFQIDFQIFKTPYSPKKYEFKSWFTKPHNPDKAGL